MVFCFCCKVFRKGISKGKLDGEGYADWHRVTTRVKEHEISLDHLTNRNKWFDMRKILNFNETTDKVQYEKFKKERDYWKQALLRIIAVVKFLDKHNLAFRGSNEKLYQKGNGNFLGVIEMLEEFDPVIKEPTHRMTSDRLLVHYLGHLIQSELISLLAQEIKKELIKKIKETNRFESVKAIKLQLVDVREDLLLVGEKDNDVAIKLKSKDMHLDYAIREINKLTGYFKDYRESVFSKLIVEAKDIAIEMGIDLIFPQKRLIERKIRFDESSTSEEVSFTPEENFRVNYFLFIVDQAISSLETIFEQFKECDKVFGFLFLHNLRGIEDKDLKSNCHRLEKTLKFEERSDINVEELNIELKLFEIFEIDVAMGQPGLGLGSTHLITGLKIST
ncbi:uncharacterized protein LOC111898319 [Lactuca sativa]|uniref:uncharacterized protein LOC111898319 n=1 Tax=Lactuca sativa TaxID=4236 RepID=UPI000CD9F7C3|nr:uncharacterized protein LOC111898319 [Lactuca sativa]